MKGLISDSNPRVTAVIPAYGKPDALATTLDHLASAQLDEVIVVDNSSSPEIRAVVEGRGEGVRLIDPGTNLGVAARNLASREASGELLLSLDDDSYPLPGAVEAMVGAMSGNPATAVVGGLMRDRDSYGRRLSDDEVGSWDWWLRCGQGGEPPEEGFESNLFSEGAAMIRRDAFLEVGGWFEPFFHLSAEVDLTTRLIGSGWEIRYLPGACFEHMREPKPPQYFQRSVYYRTRNQLWYYWLRFPTAVAIRRIPAYLLYFLGESLFRRQPGAWARAVRDAWWQRSRVADARQPLPRSVIRKAERDRGRRLLRLMLTAMKRRLPGSDWRPDAEAGGRGPA